MELHLTIRNIMDRILSEKQDPVLGTREIVDLMNIIGKCVVSGNLRRTAEIALGDHDDLEFINLKNYDINPERMDYGWVSNNSIYAQIG